MKLSWTIDDRDVLAAQELVAAHAAHPLMRSRRRNVDGSAPLVTLERFWNALVGCLLSTQQRSHVGGRVLSGSGMAGTGSPFPQPHRTREYNRRRS